MGFADSKSTTTVKGDTDAIIDQAVTESARVIQLQNIEVGKKGKLKLDVFEAGAIDVSGLTAEFGGIVNLDFTSAEAIDAAAGALAGAQAIALRGIDTSTGVLLAQLEANANLLGDVGSVLGAGFESAIEFAAESRTESNLIAAAIAGGSGTDAIPALGGSPARKAALAAAALAVLAFGFFKLKG